MLQLMTGELFACLLSFPGSLGPGKDAAKALTLTSLWGARQPISILFNTIGKNFYRAFPGATGLRRADHTAC